MLKAAFFDIDGTLVSFKTHAIPSSTIEALHLLHECGVKLFVASGRHKVSMDKVTPYEDLFDGFVQVNGGLCTIGDEVVYRNMLTRQAVRGWLDQLKIESRPTCLVTETEVIANYIDEDFDRLFEILDFPLPRICNLEDYADANVYQLMIAFKEEENDEVLAHFPDCYAPRWSPLFSDVIPMGVNKLVGIDKVLERYGIDRSEAIAFGDGGNDVEMIGGVGLGIAMGNAAPELKEIADRVTSTVDEDGILRAVNELINEGLIVRPQSKQIRKDMIQTVTDQTLDQILSEASIVCIEIGSPGCGPCKALQKTIHEIAPSYEGKVTFATADMGSGEVDDLCMAYRVMSAPTLLIFKGGELDEKLTGAVRREQLESKLNSLI